MRSPPGRSRDARRHPIEPGQSPPSASQWQGTVDGPVVITAAVNWLMGEEDLDPPWTLGRRASATRCRSSGSATPARSLPRAAPDLVGGGREAQRRDRRHGHALRQRRSPTCATPSRGSGRTSTCPWSRVGLGRTWAGQPAGSCSSRSSTVVTGRWQTRNSRQTLSPPACRRRGRGLPSGNGALPGRRGHHDRPERRVPSGRALEEVALGAERTDDGDLDRTVEGGPRSGEGPPGEARRRLGDPARDAQGRLGRVAVPARPGEGGVRQQRVHDRGVAGRAGVVGGGRADAPAATRHRPRCRGSRRPRRRSA